VYVVAHVHFHVVMLIVSGTSVLFYMNFGFFGKVLHVVINKVANYFVFAARILVHIFEVFL
jgi:hypothetical protein